MDCAKTTARQGEKHLKFWDLVRFDSNPIDQTTVFKMFNMISQESIVFQGLITPYSHRLIHWGLVMHICIGNLIIIGSDNGLVPTRWQGILLTGPLGTNLSGILIKIRTFSFKKMHFKLSSAKWQPFCLGLNVLTHSFTEKCNNEAETFQVCGLRNTLFLYWTILLPKYYLSRKTYITAT